MIKITLFIKRMQLVYIDIREAFPPRQWHRYIGWNTERDNTWSLRSVCCLTSCNGVSTYYALPLSNQKCSVITTNHRVTYVSMSYTFFHDFISGAKVTCQQTVCYHTIYLNI